MGTVTSLLSGVTHSFHLFWCRFDFWKSTLIPTTFVEPVTASLLTIGKLLLSAMRRSEYKNEPL